MSRIVLIINGDTNSGIRDIHQENVERVIDTLRADRSVSDTRIYVANPHAIESREVDSYTEATSEGIAELVREMQSNLTTQDELVIYVTGHGDEEGTDGYVCLEDGCSNADLRSLLDIQGYDSRVVIMDQCFGGNWRDIFIDDPRTLFISAGSRSDTVCCHNFAPYFWAAYVEDHNHDGIVNWQERYANVEQSGGDITSALFVSSLQYVQPGDAPFASELVQIQENADLPEEDRQEEMRRHLNAQVASLQAGQYAIVAFSVSLGCGACQQFEPSLEAQARDGRGQYLFIRYDSWETPPEFQAYTRDERGRDFRPSVVVVDHRGIIYRIDEQDREHILDVIRYHDMTNEQRWLMAIRGLNSEDDQVILESLRQIAYIRRHGFTLPLDLSGWRQFLQMLRSHFRDENDDLAAVAIEVYTSIFPLIQDPEMELEELIADGGTLGEVAGQWEDQSDRRYNASDFFRRLSNRQRRRYLRALEPMLSSRNARTQKIVSWLYPAVVNGMSIRQRYYYVRHIRLGLDHVETDQLATRLRIYSRIYYHNILEFHQAAPVLRALMHHEDPGVSDAALRAYAEIIDQLRDPEEVQLGVRALLREIGHSRRSFHSVEAIQIVFLGLRGVFGRMSDLDLITVLGILIRYIEIAGLNRDQYNVISETLTELGGEIRGRSISPTPMLYQIMRRAMENIVEHYHHYLDNDDYNRRIEEVFRIYLYTCVSPEQHMQALALLNQLVLIHNPEEDLMARVLYYYYGLIETLRDQSGFDQERDRAIGGVHQLIYRRETHVADESGSIFAYLISTLDDRELMRQMLFLYDFYSNQAARVALGELQRIDNERFLRLYEMMQQGQSEE